MHEAGFISGYHSLQSNLYYKLKGEWEELLPQVYVPLESPSHLWLAVPLPAPSSTFGASVMPASWPASSLGEETQFQKVKTKVLHEKKKKKKMMIWIPKGAICCVASRWQSIYFSGNPIYFAEAVLVGPPRKWPKRQRWCNLGVIDQSKFLPAYLIDHCICPWQRFLFLNIFLLIQIIKRE